MATQPQSSAPRETGRVKWFSQNKRYGFIVDDRGDERFLHADEVRGNRTPREGDQMEFEPGEGKKGLRAHDAVVESQGPDRQDSRETCGNCGKAMVPRLITGPPPIRFGNWTPEPKHSLCPFCGGVHRRFEKKLAPARILRACLVLFIAYVLGSVWLL